MELISCPPPSQRDERDIVRRCAHSVCAGSPTRGSTAGSRAPPLKRIASYPPALPFEPQERSRPDSLASREVPPDLITRTVLDGEGGAGKFGRGGAMWGDQSGQSARLPDRNLAMSVAYAVADAFSLAAVGERAWGPAYLPVDRSWISRQTALSSRPSQDESFAPHASVREIPSYQTGMGFSANDGIVPGVALRRGDEGDARGGGEGAGWGVEEGEGGGSGGRYWSGGRGGEEEGAGARVGDGGRVNHDLLWPARGSTCSTSGADTLLPQLEGLDACASLSSASLPWPPLLQSEAIGAWPTGHDSVRDEKPAEIARGSVPKGDGLATASEWAEAFVGREAVRGSDRRISQLESEAQHAEKAREYEGRISQLEMEAQSVQLLEVEHALEESTKLLFSLPFPSPALPCESLPDVAQSQLMLLSASLGNLQLSASTHQLELYNFEQQTERSREEAELVSSALAVETNARAGAEVAIEAQRRELDHADRWRDVGACGELVLAMRMGVEFGMRMTRKVMVLRRFVI